DGPDRTVGAGAYIKRGVNRAIRVQTGDSAQSLVVEFAETARNQDFAVLLQGDGPHGPVGAAPRQERRVDLAIGQQSGDALSLRSVVGAEFATNQHPAWVRPVGRIQRQSRDKSVHAISR